MRISTSAVISWNNCLIYSFSVIQSVLLPVDRDSCISWKVTRSSFFLISAKTKKTMCAGKLFEISKHVYSCMLLTLSSKGISHLLRVFIWTSSTWFSLRIPLDLLVGLRCRCQVMLVALSSVSTYSVFAMSRQWRAFWSNSFWFQSVFALPWGALRSHSGGHS